jgi:hypothetical protein
VTVCTAYTVYHCSDLLTDSVQYLLSFFPLSKNVKIGIFKTVTLPVVLYGCETWSVTLREEHRLRVFENKVLRTIFRPNGMK